jgi:hypothetical protein
MEWEQHKSSGPKGKRIYIRPRTSKVRGNIIRLRDSKVREPSLDVRSAGSGTNINLRDPRLKGSISGPGPPRSGGSSSG